MTKTESAAATNSELLSADDMSAVADKAQNQKNWAEAISAWEQCLAQHPREAKPRWYTGLGTCFMADGQIDAAENILTIGAGKFKKFPGGAASLARCAMRRKDWDVALERWDTYIAAYPEQATDPWHIGRADCLLQLGQLPDAQEVLSEVLQKSPKSIPALQLSARVALRLQDWNLAAERWTTYLDTVANKVDQLRGPAILEMAATFYMTDQNPKADALVEQAMQSKDADSVDFRRAYVGMLTRSRQLDRMVQSYENGFLSKIDPDVSDFTAARGLVTCNRIEDARRILDHGLSSEGDAVYLERSLPVIALAFDAEERRDHFKLVSSRAAEITKADPEDLTAHIVRMDAALGTEDMVFLRSAVDDFVQTGHDKVPFYRELARRLENQQEEKLRSGKVFGIGLSKTGTTSLTSALEILEYRTAHWANPLTYELLSDRDVVLFDALTDTPISYQFERLDEVFPNSKFVYTTRPIDEWARSFDKHMARDLDVKDFAAFTDMVRGEAPVRYGQVYRDIHNDLYCDHGNTIDAYKNYDARVRDYFSGPRSDRLMEFDVFAGDGFEKLCEYLGKPIPETPFPWSNSAATRRTTSVASKA